MKEIDRNISHIRNDTLRAALEPFGFTVEKDFIFDCGGRVYIKGPGVPFLFSGVAECDDDWTPSGDALQKLIDLGLVPDVVIEGLVSKEENGGTDQA